MTTIKDELCAELDRRVTDKILEPTNAQLLKKLISQADSDNEAIMIAELGTTYKRTGLHFDKRLEKMTNEIHFFTEGTLFPSGPNQIRLSETISANLDFVYTQHLPLDGRTFLPEGNSIS